LTTAVASTPGSRPNSSTLSRVTIGYHPAHLDGGDDPGEPVARREHERGFRATVGAGDI
jgi:hypothetical protein